MKYYVGDILRERHIVGEQGEEWLTNIFVIKRNVSDGDNEVWYNTFMSDPEGIFVQDGVSEERLDKCEYVGRMDMSMMIGSQKEYEIVRERCEELEEEKDRIQKIIDLNEKRFGK